MKAAPRDETSTVTSASRGAERDNGVAGLLERGSEEGQHGATDDPYT
jgi:hypothetical protein